MYNILHDNNSDYSCYGIYIDISDSYIKGIYSSGQQTKPVNGVIRYLIGT